MAVGETFRRGVNKDPAKLIKVDCRSGDVDTGILGSEVVGLGIGFSFVLNHRRVVVELDRAGFAEARWLDSMVELAANSYCVCMSGAAAEIRSGKECEDDAIELSCKYECSRALLIGFIAAVALFTANSSVFLSWGRIVGVDIGEFARLL